MQQVAPSYASETRAHLTPLQKRRAASYRGNALAEESNSQLTAVPKVRFIRDVPADDDFFTTHSRVAEAIVHAIRENPEIKVIGLLGRWGSGKSTVANKVVELLEEPKNSEFKVFPYDAWLHQSDPLRRSFLESLILALVRADAIAPRKWTRTTASSPTGCIGAFASGRTDRARISRI